MTLTQFTWLRSREHDPVPASGYRADIDGLRALAILLVVVYHVWLGRVSGGVDVFLMVSAFFLTASFVRRIQSERPLALGPFWLRRFRRLLPAAAVTIVGVLSVALLAYPQTEWPRVWGEAWSSLFYVENWALAFSEVDYYARASVIPSPFQHFWSLSVQGQVFLLWPLIIGGVWLVLRRRRALIVPALALVFGAIFVGSLVFSVVETMHAQSFAYFDTRTRLWEFAAGSLVALALPYIRVSAWVASTLGWIGIVGIVLCGIVLDVQGGFPGYLALWPVICTALVIVAGRDRPRGGPAALLESGPLRYISRDAYALYLVHWPVLITWMVISDRSEPGWLAGLGIVVISFVLARLLSMLVESPLRDAAMFDRSRRLGVLVLAAAVLVVAVPLTAWQIVVEQREIAVMESDSGGYPGAAQIDDPLDLSAVELPVIPLATALDSEWVDLGGTCEDELDPVEAPLAGSCVQSAAASNSDVRRILVIGDSHAQQLMSPLTVVAEEEGWGLFALLRGGCSLAAVEPDPLGALSPCEEWRMAALEYATRIEPDAVYLVATKATASSSETLVDGIEQIADRLTQQGIEVIAVRDNPRFDIDMYECVMAEADASTTDENTCDAPEIGFATGESMDALAAREGVIGVDFRPWLCPDGICRGVIGNVAVYIDDNHISSTYGRTLAPMLRDLLEVGGYSGANAG